MRGGQQGLICQFVYEVMEMCHCLLSCDCVNDLGKTWAETQVENYWGIHVSVQHQLAGLVLLCLVFHTGVVVEVGAYILPV